MGQYPNNQTTNPNGFPGNSQYPTLPHQPPAHFQNNNNNGQFQGKAGGAGQYPGGVGGYPGGQFPAGAHQVNLSLILCLRSNVLSHIFFCQRALASWILDINTHPSICSQYPRGGVPYAASEGGQGPSSKYLDEVRFPPKVTCCKDYW